MVVTEVIETKERIEHVAVSSHSRVATIYLWEKMAVARDVRQVKRQDPTQSRATESMVHGLKHWTVPGQLKELKNCTGAVLQFNGLLGRDGLSLQKARNSNS